MKLNADLGEMININHVDADLDIMPYLDQANIACGGHAGDGITMARTVGLAQQYNVQIGAHPSYPDIAGFGRRSMRMPKQDLIAILHAQIGALVGIANSQKASVDYVKPHGALYNDMIEFPSVMEHVLEALSTFFQPLSLMVQATSNAKTHLTLANKYRVPLIFEAFADRLYLENGRLAPRSQEGAVLSSEQAIEQAELLINEGVVKCISGKRLAIDANTICVHGDSPGALNMTQQIRSIIGQH